MSFLLTLFNLSHSGVYILFYFKTHCQIKLIKIMEHVTLADLGACPAHVPLRDPILSFSHTFLVKSACIGSPWPPMGPCPPMGPNSFVFTHIFGEKHPHRRSTPPLTGPHTPTGNPGSATALALQACSLMELNQWCWTFDGETSWFHKVTTR